MDRLTSVAVSVCGEERSHDSHGGTYEDRNQQGPSDETCWVSDGNRPGTEEQTSRNRDLEG